jgi:hypothetical protein
LLVRHLHVDGAYSFANDASHLDRGGSSTTAVVHFMYFWKALHEVWRRLRQGEAEEEGEPLALDMAAYRDTVLRHFEAGTLTPARLMAVTTAARKMSADRPSWASLEEVAARSTGASTSAAVLTLPADPCDCEKQVPLEVVSTLTLVWLGELTEDYLRGAKASKIQAVRDVLGCKAHDACVHLGASGWDIESALRSFYVGGPPLASLSACSLGGSWSTQSAKLRSSELQCPICVRDFCPGTESLVTRCCFQVLCIHCAASLTTNEGMLRCPFCRTDALSPSIELPTDAIQDENQEADLFKLALRTAGKYAEEATRAGGKLLQALQGVEEPRRRTEDARLDVLFGF